MLRTAAFYIFFLTMLSLVHISIQWSVLPPPLRNLCKQLVATRDISSSRSKSKKKIIPPIEPAPAPEFFDPASYHKKPFFHQRVIHQSTKSAARVTEITTPHGSFLTPSFVAVATNGVIKGVNIDAVKAEKQDLIFANSYHLLLQPGPAVIEGAGGIHKFMGMSRDRNTMGPIITDSGGFQVFSLRHGTVFDDLKSDSTTGSFSDAQTRNTAAQTPSELKRAVPLHASGSNKPGIIIIIIRAATVLSPCFLCSDCRTNFPPGVSREDSG